jgi:hypothetical protein
MSQAVHEEQETKVAKPEQTQGLVKGTDGTDATQVALRRSPQKSEHRSGFQRTAAAVRTVVPLMQKMLPLLDGNVASVVANLLLPTLQSPTVDLRPLEGAVEQLRAAYSGTHEKNVQQDAALKRLDKQLGEIHESLERITSEQAEAVEELRKARRRSLVFFLVCFLLVVVSLGMNAAIFLYFRGNFH